MESKKSKERFFSVELNSKTNLKKFTMENESCENILVEGTMGELLQAGFTEDIILEVVGREGVLRLDLRKDEVINTCQENPDIKYLRGERIV